MNAFGFLLVDSDIKVSPSPFGNVVDMDKSILARGRSLTGEKGETMASSFDREKAAFRAGMYDARHGTLMSEGIRRFAKNKEQCTAYTRGYARAIREIAMEAKREIEESKNAKQT